MWREHLHAAVFLDGYFADCVTMGQGIGSKELVTMKLHIREYWRAGGDILDMTDALVTEEAQGILRRVMLEGKPS